VFLGKAQQWLVARVIGDRARKRVICAEVDAQFAKALEQFRVVGAEEVIEIDLVRIGAPLEEEGNQVESASTQGKIERVVDLVVRIVSAREKQQNQRVIARLNGDL